MANFSDKRTVPISQGRPNATAELAPHVAPDIDEADPQPDVLPPYDDPANSPTPAGSPVQAGAPEYPAPPRDTEFAGHPDFSQDAAANKPPKGIGNSEPLDDVDEQTRHSDGVNPSSHSTEQVSGAGPALAGHSKDA